MLGTKVRLWMVHSKITVITWNWFYLQLYLECFDFQLSAEYPNSTFYSVPLRTILELGSGVGFTGIAICKSCQPRTFIFSDCHPRVLSQLGENIRLNGLTPEPDGTWSSQTQSQGQEGEGEKCQNTKVIVAELDWSSVTEKQLLGLGADVVIAAGISPTHGEQGWAGLSNPSSLLRNNRGTKTSYRLSLDSSV